MSRLEPTDLAWHELGADAVAERLETDPNRGLTAPEAAARLERWGPNALREGRRKGPVAMLLGQFTDFMIVVLIAAAIVSGVLGDKTDAAVIVAIVVLNAVIGFAQEYRAERAIAALKRMAAHRATAVRDGAPTVIPAAELVPGDVVLLEAGSAVPADLRFTEAVRLKAEEAALTGESEPVDKHTDAVSDPSAPLGDRRDMGYRGTVITYGRGRGLVVATGMQTELGRIATLLHAEEEGKTPLQRRLARFGRTLAVAVLAICAVVFGAGVARGEDTLLMLLTAISLAVAAIPEALPAVVSVALALGAGRMVRRQALVRKLPAVETLGSVSWICSDKTGTLTCNRMQVDQVWTGHAARAPDPAVEPGRTLVTALALSHDARRGAEGVVGDPTEVALLEAAEAAGADVDDLARRHPRIDELPFDSERARMTTVHTDGAGVVAYTKGAPERVLPLCTTRLGPEGPVPLDQAAVMRISEDMAGAGLRVLALAVRRFDAPCDRRALEAELVLVALVGMLDPPRPEAADAVRQCRAAGITPAMITGDHPATARAIALRLGIIGDGDPVLTGRELARLGPDDLARQIEDVRVYARVAPEQKIRIVEALQARGAFVAMTGDGVNDAPALRRADIGVAMGRSGTDVAKEAGHMILLDDDFSTIVAAVREGRRIFDNIRKFIKYTMTSNSGEIWTIFAAPFLGLPIPLLPIHILWINLVTDGLPGLALAVEPEERGLMQRPPRPPGESVFAHGMAVHIVWVGMLMGGAALATQAWALHTGAPWQTMVFTVLTLSQLGNVLAVRSERESLFTQGLGSNPALAAAVLLTVGLQLATVYVPVLQPLFRTTALSLGELGVCLAMSSLVFLAVELEKLIRRHRFPFTVGPSERRKASLRAPFWGPGRGRNRKTNRSEAEGGARESSGETG